MLKLIRMEWKTNRIGKYIRNAILDILRATLEYQVPNCMFLSQFSHNCLYAK